MPFLLLAAVVFVIHLAWESVHIRLYTNYDALKGYLPVPVWAALGDIVYTFAAVFVIALLKMDVWWFVLPHPTDFLQLAALGFLTALFVEKKAQYYKRWEYTDAMPVLPVLNIGLSPVVQKTFLFPITVWVTIVLFAVFS